MPYVLCFSPLTQSIIGLDSSDRKCTNKILYTAKENKMYGWVEHNSYRNNHQKRFHCGFSGSALDVQ